MGMEEALAPGPNFNRPVKDLVYKDLLTRAPSPKPVTTGVSKLGVSRCLTLSVSFAGTSFGMKRSM